MGRTVNPLSFDFRGSNPLLPTSPSVALAKGGSFIETVVFNFNTGDHIQSNKLKVLLNPERDKRSGMKVPEERKSTFAKASVDKIHLR